MWITRTRIFATHWTVAYSGDNKRRTAKNTHARYRTPVAKGRVVPMTAAPTQLNKPQLNLGKVTAVARASGAAGGAAAEDQLSPKGTADKPGTNPKGHADSSTRRKVVQGAKIVYSATTRRIRLVVRVWVKTRSPADSSTLLAGVSTGRAASSNTNLSLIHI